MDVLQEAKQVVNPKLIEMAQCGGGFRNKFGGGRSYGGGRGGGRGYGGRGGGKLTQIFKNYRKKNLSNFREIKIIFFFVK